MYTVKKIVIHWYTTPCISPLYACYTWGQYMPDIHTSRTLFSTSDVTHSRVNAHKHDPVGTTNVN